MYHTHTYSRSNTLNDVNYAWYALYQFISNLCVHIQHKWAVFYHLNSCVFAAIIIAYAYANGAIFSSFVKMEASSASKSIFIYLRQQIQLDLVWQQGNSLCWFGWICKSVESFIKLKLKLKLLYFCCSCQLIQSNWKFLGFFNPLNRLHPIRWSLESNGSLSILKWKIRLKNSWAYIWAYWNDPGFLPIFSDAWFESSKNKPAASFPSLFPVISLLNGLCVCWFQKKEKKQYENVTKRY